MQLPKTTFLYVLKSMILVHYSYGKLSHIFKEESKIFFYDKQQIDIHIYIEWYIS